MNRIVLLLGILLLGVISFACAPTIAPMEKPILPEAKSQDTGKADWELRWEKTLALARKEGQVVVYGPPLAEVRRSFIDAFQKAYPGITLEYTGVTGAQTSPKINAERRGGIYMVDLHIGGTTTMLTQLREFLIPIKPHLILPEVKDPRAWMDVKLDFSDNAEELNLVFQILADSRVVYNTELVNPGEITSWWDLTGPKWMEKIVMWDPRVAGSGLASASFWYFHPKLGLDYIRAIAKNRPFLSRDDRFLVETVARGKHLIGISPVTSLVFEFSRLGMPIKFAEPLKEGTYSTAAFGSVALLDRAPHPNAATIFLNWLLTREGQTIWSVKGGYASRRLDVPQDHLYEAQRIKPGVEYVPNYKEDFVMKKDEVMPSIREIFGSP